mmetsp:Transcript_16216/g.24055  ORF Transcript_16216/g.24055 Transcript_16216/m.24055 type:complete len:213 (-) Transcript_16216:67-705(-)
MLGNNRLLMELTAEKLVFEVVTVPSSSFGTVPPVTQNRSLSYCFANSISTLGVVITVSSSSGVHLIILTGGANPALCMMECPNLLMILSSSSAKKSSSSSAGSMTSMAPQHPPHIKFKSDHKLVGDLNCFRSALRCLLEIFSTSGVSSVSSDCVSSVEAVCSSSWVWTSSSTLFCFFEEDFFLLRPMIDLSLLPMIDLAIFDVIRSSTIDVY